MDKYTGFSIEKIIYFQHDKGGKNREWRQFQIKGDIRDIIYRNMNMDSDLNKL